MNMMDKFYYEPKKIVLEVYVDARGNAYISSLTCPMSVADMTQLKEIVVSAIDKAIEEGGF